MPEEVNTTVPTNTQADKDQRAREATEEIKKILDEKNCYADVFLTVGTDGTLKGEFTIKGK